MMEPGEIDRRFGVPDAAQAGITAEDAKIRTLSSQFRTFPIYLDGELPETDDTLIAKAEVFRLLEEAYEEAVDTLTVEPVLEGL